MLKDAVSYVQIKAIYCNTIIRKRTKHIITYNYKLIPMALRELGECFKLDVPKEVMPYNTYTYGNVDTGAGSIQSALDVL